jgi:uncharacterized protein YhbP (UPF0306 family)
VHDLRELAKSILGQGYLMNLGTVDSGGVWVSDVIYIHDDAFNLFWLSDPEVRHSKAVQKNPKVAATITISNNAGEQNIGLQIEGVAEKLEGNNLELATQHRLKRKKAPPTRDGEVEEGDSWYRLRPTKIEIIHEPHFGFEKQILEL